MKEMDKHHRKPRSIGGKNKPRNVIMIQQNLHRAWHTLFGNMSAPEIANLITAVYLDPDYRMVAKKKKEKKNPNQLKLNL